MNVIRSYDSHLIFQDLRAEQRASILRVFKDANLEVILDAGALEFQYSGKDADRKIVTLFQEVARLLVDAKGELRCEIDDDEEIDPSFEFFSVASGRLRRQRGHLVRESEIEDI